MSDELDDLIDGDTADPEHVARQLLVHGVVSHFANDASLDRHVEAALARTRRPSPLRIAIAAAAVITLTTGLLWTVLRDPPTLSAEVRRVIEAASRPLDLEYAVEIRGPRGGGTRARLFVRGRSHFAAAIRGRVGELWVGYDSEGSWIVPPDPSVPIVLRNTPDPLRDAMSAKGAPLPFFRIARLLDRLHTDYDLEEPTSASSDGPIRFAASRRRTRHGANLPLRIDIVADRDTGLVKVIELEIETPRRDLDSLRITLTRDNETPREDAFYRYTTHSQSGRHVVDRRRG